jgi:hypothetical protein
MITEVKKNRIHFNNMQLLHKLTMKTETAIFKGLPPFELHAISTSLLQVYEGIKDL